MERDSIEYLKNKRNPILEKQNRMKYQNENFPCLFLPWAVKIEMVFKVIILRLFLVFRSI